MLIELRKGMTLPPGTFNAVIAPGMVMASALNTNTELRRFLSSVREWQAGHTFEITTTCDAGGTALHCSSRSPRDGGLPPYTQQTPEVT